MIAYFRSQQHDQLVELVKQTADHFHKGGLWNEGNVAEFARGALGSNLLDQAAGYYQEAISLHQRSNPGSGTGDITLSMMYQQLADAQSPLGHTKAAVEAASGAVVCWGSHQSERQEAINKLHRCWGRQKIWMPMSTASTSKPASRGKTARSCAKRSAKSIKAAISSPKPSHNSN